MTTERNIRAKARRRGFSVNKYRKGYLDVYIATAWHSNPGVYDATLEELEEFIQRQEIEKR